MSEQNKGLGLKRSLKIMVAVLLLFAVVAGVGLFFYWQYLKTTPQYSLALLVDAAKRDDLAQVEKLIDSDAVVDDMMPQVVAKAVDRYGRGVPSALVARAVLATTPLMPALKQRVRPELPDLIRRETESISRTPFPLLVVGADRYLDIQTDGNMATIKKKDRENATEIRMERNGKGWKIVGLRDEKFAGEIAQRVGQEIMSVVTSGNGINVNSLLEQLQRSTQ